MVPLSRILLIEYDRNITLSKFADEITTKRSKLDPTVRKLTPTQVLARVESLDPTPHKEYTVWLLRQLLAGAKWEDLSSVTTDDLKTFNQLKLRKKLPLDKRDINRLNHRSLSSAIRDYEKDFSNSIDLITSKYKKLFDDSDVVVIQLLDYDAAVSAGRNTSWCTKFKVNWDMYSSDGDIMVVIPKKPLYKNEKYQLHLETRQCKDSHDASFKFHKLLARFPSLFDFFKNLPGFKSLPVFAVNKSATEISKRDQQKVAKEEIANILKSLW